MRVAPPQRTRVPSCPRELQGPARDAWHRTAPLLHHAGILTRLDLLGLEALCRCWGHWRQVMDHIEGGGDSPAWAEAATAWHSVVLEWMRDYYLTPRSRADAFTHDPLERARVVGTDKGA